MLRVSKLQVIEVCGECHLNVVQAFRNLSACITSCYLRKHRLYEQSRHNSVRMSKVSQEYVLLCSMRTAQLQQRVMLFVVYDCLYDICTQTLPRSNSSSWYNGNSIVVNC
jgi:hypothetical protein